MCIEKGITSNIPYIVNKLLHMHAYGRNIYGCFFMEAQPVIMNMEKGITSMIP